MNKFSIMAAVFSAAITTSAFAQLPTASYKNFYFNPFLQNAGFVTSTSGTQVDLFYKKQMTGVSEAPTTSGISLQASTGSRLSLGLVAITDNKLILKQSVINTALAYKIPLTSRQNISFGMSAGINLNRFDFNAQELGTNDPAILNAAGSTFHFNGSFGSVYTSTRLKLGFALTQLFDTDPFIKEKNNKISMQMLKNYLISVSYKFDLNPFQNFSLRPYILINRNIDDAYDYVEGAATFDYQDKIWLGASYNTSTGASLLFGLTLVDHLKLNYGYEFPAIQSKFHSVNGHQLSLRLNLGNRTRER